MKTVNSNEEYELEFYSRIFNYFQKSNFDYKKTEIWKSKTLIELMEILKRTKNRVFVANAIILLISLFEDNPPDIYNNLGDDVNQISKEEREILKAELKNEFLPN